MRKFIVGLLDFAAIVSLIGGLTAVLWGQDWRWSLTGLAGFLIFVIASNKMDSQRLAEPRGYTEVPPSPESRSTVPDGTQNGVSDDASR